MKNKIFFSILMGFTISAGTIVIFNIAIPKIPIESNFFILLLLTGLVSSEIYTNWIANDKIKNNHE